MFGSIAVSNRSVDEYVPIIGEAATESLVRFAAPLAGLRILHLTSPAASGAVRSMLATSVPLMASLGLSVQWQQVRMTADAWAMDAEQRQALSGYEGRWDSRRDAEWIAFNEDNAELFAEDFDVVVVHHTGSVGLLPALTRRLGKRPPGLWLWHSHRDYRSAQPEAWTLVRESAAAFNASFYDYRGFIRTDAPTRRRFVIPPGVDPLGARAMPVTADAHEVVLGQRGISLDRPILSQIVFSTREEDPLSVLSTYELVKAYRPDTQLVIVNMVQSAALDDVLEVMNEQARKLGDCLILTAMDHVGNVELALLRDVSTLMLHQGLPRGVSMELLEEMWQSKPIISGRSPVALATLKEGRSALFADTPMEQAEAIIKLLDDPKAAARLGARAHAEVAGRYLATHSLERQLGMLGRLLKRRARQS